jgi:hypothetical protein
VTQQRSVPAACTGYRTPERWFQLFLRAAEVKADLIWLFDER